MNALDLHDLIGVAIHAPLAEGDTPSSSTISHR